MLSTKWIKKGFEDDKDNEWGGGHARPDKTVQKQKPPPSSGAVNPFIKEQPSISNVILCSWKHGEKMENRLNFKGVHLTPIIMEHSYSANLSRLQ